MNNKNGLVICGLALALLSPVTSSAADAKNGKTLHDASCLTQCHASRANGDANKFYSRENRKKTLEALRAQVSACNSNVLNSKWFPDDEADVVEYLNQEFYHFK